MSKCPFDDDWVPAQVQKPEIIDFRPVAYGPRGYKVKNGHKFAAEAVADGMEVDTPTPVKLGGGERKTLGLGSGKISKRIWKKRGRPACSMRDTGRSMTLNEIKEERESRKRFRQMKRDIKEARGTRLRELRERKEKAEQKKKENQLKSAVVQKISNAKTLKKMMKSKKQRKLLMKQ